MKSPEKCPTCGTTLGPLHADALVRCGTCQRLNPRGFSYCGHCAAPMVSDARQAELAEVAAPPGGWPNLSRELVELRFYMERGELDEAFELLTILRDRHPGHPALAEFNRRPQGSGPRPDTQVNRVVDSVLAGSQALSSALPRRAAPQWKAPEIGDEGEGDQGHTRAHAKVSLGSDERAAGVRKRVVRSDDTRKAGSFPVIAPSASEAEPAEAKAPPARAMTQKHVGAFPVKAPEAPEPEEATEVSSSATSAEVALPSVSEGAAASPAAEPAPSPGLTVAVPTLQAPAPFHGESPRSGEGHSPVRKRALKSRKRSGRQALVDSKPESKRRKRKVRFGENVLGRFGKE